MSKQYPKYSLKKITNSKCRDDISSRSDQFKSIQAPIMIKNNIEYQIDRDNYINILTYKIDNAYSVFYGSLPAPDDEEIIRKVIGKGGCYFYLTTITNGILFIWHNRITQNFEFWGEKPSKVLCAMGAIELRINKSLEYKLKLLSNKLEKFVSYNSITVDDIKYNKIKIGNTHYFVKDTIDKNPPVYSIVGENLIGKFIGNYIEYDNYTKGPTIQLSYEAITSDLNEEHKVVSSKSDNLDECKSESLNDATDENKSDSLNEVTNDDKVNKYEEHKSDSLNDVTINESKSVSLNDTTTNE
jgi:hypothetical protein